jgi:hypothetical protein
VRPVPNRDCAVRTSLIAIDGSRRELSALRSGLREPRQIINEARACVERSRAANAIADRLLQEASRFLNANRLHGVRSWPIDPSNMTTNEVLSDICESYARILDACAAMQERAIVSREVIAMSKQLLAQADKVFARGF